MPEIVEGDLIFDFGGSWLPVKYDEHPDYQNKIRKFDACRAVDFVALAQSSIWFIEVKDFRGYPVNNVRRITSGALALEVATKVRDSIAGIVGARQMSSTPDLWFAFMGVLNMDRSIRVILWLEEDLHLEAGYATTLGQALKKHLRWLTTRVLVLSVKDDAAPSDLRVRYKPGGIRP